GMGCSVGIEEWFRPRAVGASGDERFVVGTHHRRPAGVVIARGELGDTVGNAVVLIELMGELMDDDIHPVIGVAPARDDVVPRKNDGSGVPRFPVEDTSIFGLTKIKTPSPMVAEGTRINQD